VAVSRDSAASVRASAIPKIRDHRLALVQQDVFGLDVAMDDAVMMRVIQGAGDLPRDGQRFIDAELLLTVQLAAQRLSPDVGLDIPEESVRLPRVDEGEDVRMIQAGGDLHFIEKSLGAELGGDLGPQHLEGDFTVVLQLAREKNGRHAARAELALDGVAIR